MKTLALAAIESEILRMENTKERFLKRDPEAIEIEVYERIINKEKRILSVIQDIDTSIKYTHKFHKKTFKIIWFTEKGVRISFAREKKVYVEAFEFFLNYTLWI